MNCVDTNLTFAPNPSSQTDTVPSNKFYAFYIKPILVRSVKAVTFVLAMSQKKSCLYSRTSYFAVHFNIIIASISTVTKNPISSGSRNKFYNNFTFLDAFYLTCPYQRTWFVARGTEWRHLLPNNSLHNLRKNKFTSRQVHGNAVNVYLFVVANKSTLSLKTGYKTNL